MYLQCYTAEEIAEVVGIDQANVSREIQLVCEMEMNSKTHQTANFQDDFQIPIYNRYIYGEATNATDHTAASA